MADTCTYCGKDLDGVYQYYWGNPCHPECSPANTAAAKEREFQRQFGRDEATRATPPASVVEAMEKALRAISDLTALSATDFADKHPDLNAKLDARPQEHWYDVLSSHAYEALADLEAWRAGK